MTGFADAAPKPKKTRRSPKKAELKEARHRIKLYAQSILQGHSKMQSALMAGYKKSIALKAKDKIERPNAAYFNALMDHFIPDQMMAMKVREGLGATAVKVASFEGRITDVQEFADFNARAKYVEIAAKLKGRMGEDGSAANINVPIQVNIDL
jgi:hypothetical protein